MQDLLCSQLLQGPFLSRVRSSPGSALGEVDTRGAVEFVEYLALQE